LGADHGTARGRIGYLITPTFQLYGTGGLAYGSVFLNTRANSAFGGVSANSAGAVSSSWWLLGSDTSYASNSQLLFGYTAGAGGEWMLMPNWSIKAEALYYNLGTQSVSNNLYSYGYSRNQISSGLPTFSASSTTQARYDGVIGRAGVNYHFNWNTPAEGTTAIAAGLPSLKSPSTLTSVPSWTGLYAGLNAGYAFGVTQGAANYGWANPALEGPGVSPNDSIPFALANSAPGQGVNQGGFIGGGQVGYNYQYGQKIVFGFETDMQGAGIRGTGNANGVGQWADGTSGAFVNNNIIQAGIDWLGTARGRIGYLITPTFQVYGTGGIAYGNAFLNTFANSSAVYADGVALGSAWDYYGTTTSYASKSQLLVGYSVGGGGEWMVFNNWSLKAEAIYYNLGTQSVENTYYNASPATLLAGSTTRARYDGVIGRAGVNYHFDFGRAVPVVAKF
jgi:outer membrane immunogenic protein